MEKQLIIALQFPTGLLNTAEKIQQARDRGAKHIENKQDKNLIHNAENLPSSRPSAFLCQQGAQELLAWAPPCSLQLK